MPYFNSMVQMIFVLVATIGHCFFTIIKPSGFRQLVAEMIALRVQLLIARRKLKKAPALEPMERLVLALAVFLIPIRRLRQIASVVSPATILKFHRKLVNRKYSQLYRNKGSGKKRGRPPIDSEIRKLVLEIKRRNPSSGCPRIVNIVFDRTGVLIDKETVRQILKKYYRPPSGSGPSWLSFVGSQVDSLWSCDLFRVESIRLTTYWVLVVMDQHSRQIIGFAVNRGNVCGETLCAMFNQILGSKKPPKRLSHDNDPLFRFHRWKSNMSILEIDELWSVPFTPISHPYVERLIGVTRQEFLDHILFWGKADLERKLDRFREYFCESRVHSGIGGQRPSNLYRTTVPKKVPPRQLRWKSYCNGLFKMPEAA